MKTVFKLPRLTSSKLLYDTSGVIPLDKYIKSCSAVLVFKSLKFGWHNNYIVRQSGNYVLRTDLHLPTPACRTTKFGKNGVLYKAVSIYDSLSNDLKKIDTVSKFKKQIRRVL